MDIHYLVVIPAQCLPKLCRLMCWTALLIDLSKTLRMCESRRSGISNASQINGTLALILLVSRGSHTTAQDFKLTIYSHVSSPACDKQLNFQF